MALVTVAEVATYMQAVLDAPSQAFFEMAIPDVEALLAERIGRPLEPTESTYSTLTSLYQCKIFLPKTPVISIESVRVNTDTLDPDGYQVDTWGILLSYPLPAGSHVEIDYTAGLPPERVAAVKIILFDALARAYNISSENLQGVRSIGDLSLAFPGALFTESQITQLNRLRRIGAR